MARGKIAVSEALYASACLVVLLALARCAPSKGASTKENQPEKAPSQAARNPVNQTTWGGLRFGMTEAEVKSVLKEKVVPAGPSLATPGGRSTSYTPLQISSVAAGPATGTGALSFDNKKRGLVNVTLDFSRFNKKNQQPWGVISEKERDSRIETYLSISEQLVDKYGAPAAEEGEAGAPLEIVETGHCPTRHEATSHFFLDPSGKIECTRVWKQPHQKIQMNLLILGDSLFLFIIYSPPAEVSPEL